MILKISLLSLALTTQWFRAWPQGAWNQPTPYLDSTWDEYDSSVPAKCVDLPAGKALGEVLKENFSIVILLSKEDRALAHGFIDAVLAQNRGEELLAIIENAAEPDQQYRALSALANYFYRTQDAQAFGAKYLERVARAVVEHIVTTKRHALLDDLYSRFSYAPAEALFNEITRRMFDLEHPLTVEEKESLIFSNRAISRWISSTHPEIFERFLYEVSWPILLNSKEVWDRNIRESLISVIRSYAGRKESTNFFRETFFQVSLVRPALDSPIGDAWVQAYFLQEQSPQAQAQMLLFALASEEHRLQLLSQEMIRRSSDATFDEILKSCPEDFRGCDRIFEIFFERDGLSPGSRERILEWLQRPQGQPIERVYDRLGVWRETAYPILPSLLSFYSSSRTRDLNEGIAAMLSKTDLKELLRSLPLNLDQRVRLIDALTYSKETPLVFEVANSLWHLLSEPEELYDLDKDRKLTNALLGYFAHRAGEASDLELETLLPILQRVFALPPDATTDHPLLILLRAMKSRFGDRFSEVQKMLDEMK